MKCISVVKSSTLSEKKELSMGTECYYTENKAKELNFRYENRRVTSEATRTQRSWKDKMLTRPQRNSQQLSVGRK